MTRLSKKAKTRLDEAVMITASRLYSNPSPLTRLHFSRPDKFALAVSKYILNHRDVREMLDPLDLGSLSGTDRIKLVEATVRRLHRRGDLRRAELKVPVLLGGTGARHLEDRMMSCYWPATILDQLARC